jgi:hypothetical protein
VDLSRGNQLEPLEQEEIYTQYPDSIKNEIITTEELSICSINFTHNNSIWRRGVKGSSWGNGDERIKPVAGFSSIIIKRDYPDREFPKLFAISSTAKNIVELQNQTGLPFCQNKKVFRVEIPGEYFSTSGCKTLIKVVKEQSRYKRVPVGKIKLDEFFIELIGVEVKFEIDIFAEGQNLAERNDTHCLFLHHTYAAQKPHGLGMYLPPKKFHIWLARIFCTQTEAFVEYRWHPKIGISIDVKRLDRIEPKRRVVETKQALKGMFFLGLAKEPRGGSEREEYLYHLKWHYGQVYPKWQEAKKIYNECMKSKNKVRREKWKESILSVYPDLQEQPDLLERISNSPKLSKEVFTILEVKGGEGTAYEIALEHAARLCGASNYAHHISTLKDTLKMQNKYG